MVRQTDPSLFSDVAVDFKVDEDPCPLGMFEMSFMVSTNANWTDDTPPDTPRIGSPDVSVFIIFHGIRDAPGNEMAVFFSWR